MAAIGTLRDRLDELFHRAAVGIAQLDVSGRFLLVNDQYCQLLGRSRDELLAAQIQDLLHQEDLPTSLEAFIRVIETGESLVIDYRHVRRDGSIVWLSNSVSAGRDSHGKANYVLIVAQDVTSRKETERLMSRVQTDLRMVLDSAADGLFCVDRECRVILCNAAFLRMLGFSREEDAIGRDLYDIVRCSRADGSQYLREESPLFKAARSGVHSHHIDDLFFRTDGTSFPVEYWVRPIVRSGEIEGAVCTFVDATMRKQVEARQAMINHELAHRVKNTLAIVQVIVSQTLNKSTSRREAMKLINERLSALAQAHSVLTHTRTGTAPITNVIESAIAAHRLSDARIQTSGPQIDLGTKAALALTLALHELCTNAEKYGALSNEVGLVSVTWAVSGGAADQRFELNWREIGGPPVVEPKNRGFGSKLISQIGGDFEGEATLNFDPAGVSWRLVAPVTQLKRSFFES